MLGLARHLGTSWKTVWRSVRPLLQVMDADPSRFDGVQILGVDEHIIAEHVLASFPSCPIKEIARLGRTLRKWREPFLAYFATGRANNGGTEAVNGLIELHRRVARGFRNRDNYRLRMLLIGGAFTDPRLV